MDQVRVRVYNKVCIMKNKKNELYFVYDPKCNELWTAAELLAEIQKISARTGLPISRYAITDPDYGDERAKYPMLMSGGFGPHIYMFHKPDHRTYA